MLVMRCAAELYLVLRNWHTIGTQNNPHMNLGLSARISHVMPNLTSHSIKNNGWRSISPHTATIRLWPIL